MYKRICGINGRTSLGSAAAIRDRHWVFTLYNPSAEEAAGAFLSPQESVEFFVLGREVGEEGIPHLQGYIVLNQKKDLKWVKANIHKTAQWEIMRGTPKQVSDFCKKNGDFVEVGELPDAAGSVGFSELSEDDDSSALERNLKQDLPRILPYLNITAESLESRGALYEPVVKLMKCYHECALSPLILKPCVRIDLIHVIRYRPDMLYDQANLCVLFSLDGCHIVFGFFCVKCLRFGRYIGLQCAQFIFHQEYKRFLVFANVLAKQVPRPLIPNSESS